MGDQQHGHAARLLKALEQLQDLGLHGHVERGRRLVGDQQRRIAGQGDGDRNALLLAAGQFVRVAPGCVGNLIEAHLRQQLGNAPLGIAFAPHVLRQDLGDLGGNGHQRIERRRRILEYNGDFAAANRAQLLLGQGRADRGPRTLRARTSKPSYPPASGRSATWRSSTCPIRIRRPGPGSGPAAMFE